MKRLSAWLLGFVLVAGSAACAGTETGNPPAEGGPLQVSYAPLSASYAPDAAHEYALDRASVELESFAIQTCSDDDVPVLPEPRVVELLDAEHDRVELDEASHCTLTLSIGDLVVTLSSVADADLGQGTTSQVSRMATAGVETLLQVREPGELSSHPHTLLAFDVESWLAPLGFEVDANDRLVLGNGVDQAAFEDAVRRGVVLLEDADADGELDPEERTAEPLAEVVDGAAD